MIKVLFVCLGNICRSPMAQFVFQQMVDNAGLHDIFEINSAGTESYNEINHEGIHYGTREILTQMHVPFTEHYSKQIRKSDYEKYDYIIAMDENNVEDIQSLIGPDKGHKVSLLLDYTTHPRKIKDPWYTGNFDETYWDIVDGCQCFLKWLKKNGKV